MTEKVGEGGWAERLAKGLGMKPQQANLVKLLAVAIALGILFLNAGELFGVVDQGQRPQGATEVSTPRGAPQDELARMEEEMARTLERTLSRILGAGEVQVSVMLEAGPTITAIPDTRVDKNTTTETATDGSRRETQSTNTTTTNVVTKAGGNDSLAVMKRSRAQIAGVLIVADGARSATVRARIHEAAVVALGISPNRIAVVPAKGE